MDSKETMEVLKEIMEARKFHSRAMGDIDSGLWVLLKKYRTKLRPKEYLVLKARWWQRKTLEEIGKEMGVTRERVRQLEGVGEARLACLMTGHYDGQS